MNKLIAITLVFLLLSCDKICSVSTILCLSKKKKTEVIDFTQIDQFPQFKNCDETLNFDQSKACFEKEMHNKISTQIQKLKLTSNEDITDTLKIEITINKNGQFLCNKIITKDSLDIKIPDLTLKIKQIIQALPSIHPAQKRGIPVSSTYTIPLVINTQ